MESNKNGWLFQYLEAFGEIKCKSNHLFFAKRVGTGLTHFHNSKLRKFSESEFLYLGIVQTAGDIPLHDASRFYILLDENASKRCRKCEYQC